MANLFRTMRTKFSQNRLAFVEDMTKHFGVFLSVHSVDADNSNEGNDVVKRQVLRRFRKTVSVGAEVTTGGRLFQRRLPATGNARSPTVDSRVRLCVRSLAATKTMSGDGGGWNRRRTGCDWRDTVAPDLAGIDKQAQPA